VERMYNSLCVEDRLVFSFKRDSFNKVNLNNKDKVRGGNFVENNLFL